eukprot:TRINITY_DN24888_c0_g1_i1.p1 TRINITY_DN24888_c0_g1~~TRINITY_DN24888_c0_g1_i1.p1  ORF type:complete len:377 (-),score=21.33 TRINITY_DN24888_c0_g1_i1:175-1305(-)
MVDQERSQARRLGRTVSSHSRNASGEFEDQVTGVTEPWSLQEQSSEAPHATRVPRARSVRARVGSGIAADELQVSDSWNPADEVQTSDSWNSRPSGSRLTPSRHPRPSPSSVSNLLTPPGHNPGFPLVVRPPESPFDRHGRRQLLGLALVHWSGFANQSMMELALDQAGVRRWCVTNRRNALFTWLAACTRWKTLQAGVRRWCVTNRRNALFTWLAACTRWKALQDMDSTRRHRWRRSRLVEALHVWILETETRTFSRQCRELATRQWMRRSKTIHLCRWGEVSRCRSFAQSTQSTSRYRWRRWRLAGALGRWAEAVETKQAELHSLALGVRHWLRGRLQAGLDKVNLNLNAKRQLEKKLKEKLCLLYTSPSPRDS